MTTTLTLAKALIEAAEKAKAGEWTAWDRGIGWEVHTHGNLPVNDEFRETFRAGDAAFIATARNDAPDVARALVEAMEILRKVDGLMPDGTAAAMIRAFLAKHDGERE